MVFPAFLCADVDTYGHITMSCLRHVSDSGQEVMAALSPAAVSQPTGNSSYQAPTLRMLSESGMLILVS